MKKVEVAALCEYVRWVADEVGLRDWHFDVFVTDEPPEGALAHDDKYRAAASCSPTIGRKHANIYFAENFRDLSPEEQREIVVHELVHCHLTHLREFVRSGLHEHVNQLVYNAISFGFDLQWEYTVDAIARPWAMRMPRIRWPK